MAAALIPAAGRGSRVGLGPKWQLSLGGRTLLEILTETLSPLVDEIVVAAPEGAVKHMRAVMDGRGKVIAGGASRHESVGRLIAASASDLLLIQDVARPFASAALCGAVLTAGRKSGAAGAFLSPAVPVGYISRGQVADYWDRETAGIFQAPQAFSRKLLELAMANTAGQEFQSTAQMLISAGFPLKAVPGETTNIKITTPLDWEIARLVIAPQLEAGA